MNEYDENNLLYSDSDISVTLDTSEFSSEESILDSEVTSDSLEESSEERREEESERSSEYTESYVGSEDPVLSHIDTTLNNIFGLIIGALVLVGCGLILKYIWGLLNK